MRRAVAWGTVLVISAMLTPGLASAVGSPVIATVDLPRHSAVVTATKLAADYYRTTYAHPTVLPTNGWSWATYAQGVQALYRQAGDQRYLSDGLAWGQSNAWGISPASVQANPDSIKAGQTYVDLNAIDPTASLAVMDAAMATDLTGLPLSQYDWIDALFMGLPNWAQWATRTGNPAYLDKLDALYAWARTAGGTSARCAGKPPAQAGLFDAAASLWYRDCTVVGAKDVNGQPVFWARGNGWTIAAMAQVLQRLPAGDPRGVKYADMLATMAARLVALQGSDGMWRASLTDAALYPAPETSGTALITYALAYGIKAGILDAPTYLPVVARAWSGLTTISLQPSGFVAGCQGPGVGPGTSYTAKAPRTAPTSTSSGTVNVDSPPYCVGALLLAGSEVAQLTGTAIPTDSMSSAYVTRVYQDLFHRVPDPSGLRSWTDALISGTSRVAVANGITSSTEYRSGLISGAYHDFLGRVPDPQGLNDWLAAMGGGMTIQAMESGFLASPEYYHQSGTTDAGWVRRLYQNVLGRAAGESEVQGWVNVLVAGGTRQGVAIGFVTSTERLTSDVNGYYQGLLGRAVDPSGQQTWVGASRNGMRTEAIIGGIIASAEYYANL